MKLIVDFFHVLWKIIHMVWTAVKLKKKIQNSFIEKSRWLIRNHKLSRKLTKCWCTSSIHINFNGNLICDAIFSCVSHFFKWKLKNESYLVRKNICKWWKMCKKKFIDNIVKCNEQKKTDVQNVYEHMLNVTCITCYMLKLWKDCIECHKH